MKSRPKTARERERCMVKFTRSLRDVKKATGADAVFALSIWKDEHGRLFLVGCTSIGDVRRLSQSEQMWLRKALTPAAPPRLKHHPRDDLPF